MDVQCILPIHCILPILKWQTWPYLNVLSAKRTVPISFLCLCKSFLLRQCNIIRREWTECVFSSGLEMEWNQMMNSGFPDTGLFRTVADATHSQLLLKTLSAAVSTLSSCPFYSSPFLNSFLPIVDATLSPFWDTSFHPKQTLICLGESPVMSKEAKQI